MIRSSCSVVDKSLALYPGVPSLIISSSSLSDETLSHDPASWDVKTTIDCEPSRAARHNKEQSKNTDSELVNAN